MTRTFHIDPDRRLFTLHLASDAQVFYSMTGIDRRHLMGFGEQWTKLGLIPPGASSQEAAQRAGAVDVRPGRTSR